MRLDVPIWFKVALGIGWVLGLSLLAFLVWAVYRVVMHFT
jgi:hypothetical protein